MNAIFIRHSESIGNADDVVKGTGDYPLNADGKRESQMLAARIARLKPTVVISSPLSRAAEPAAMIAKKAGVALHIDKDLLPQNFGDLEGTPRTQGEPIIRDAAKNTPDDPMPNGESFNGWMSSNDTAMRRVKMLVAQGERPAVVTHSRNLRELPHSLFGDAPSDPTRGGPEPSGYQIWTKGKKLETYAPPTAQRES